MPAFWKALGRGANLGINLWPLMESQTIQGNQVGLWTPSVIFPDATDIDVTNQFLKLFEYGHLEWEQHIVMTLVESSFNYEGYPHETQDIYVRFYSFAVPAQELLFIPQEKPILLFANNVGTPAIRQNPLWTFDSAAVAFDSITFTGFYPRSVGTVQITVKRQNEGMIWRLAVPILLLVVLAGVAFWADPIDRMNITITVLLSVSALYIVVFQNIPMIGYLTKFDFFVLFMFVALFICCNLHQLIIRLRLQEKLSKWPLRKLYIRGLELMGRVAVIPIVIAVFLTTFDLVPTVMSQAQFVSACVLVSLFTAFILIREIGDMKKVLRRVHAAIRVKMGALEDLSRPELYLFNYMEYNMISDSRHYYMDSKAKSAKIDDNDATRKASSDGGHRWNDRDQRDIPVVTISSKGGGGEQGVQMKSLDLNPINKARALKATDGRDSDDEEML